MSTAQNKLNLVQMIIDSEDKSFIERMMEYARALKKQKTADWAEDLPDHILEELRLSIDEAENGIDSGIPHSEMMEEAKRSFPHLKM